MTSNYPLDMDSGTVDSVSSTPRSEATNRLNDDLQPRIRFMCSFGGQILPRPHDNQLRYVGGDTRIVAVNRSISYSALLTKLSRLSTTPEFTVKYQLPNEDLDALISVSTDEDVENMIDEYDRLIQGTNPKLARLRLFMFPIGNSLSCTSSIGSLLDGSTKRENWFLDALNGGGGGGSASLDRVRSEASSIVSEVPDYLFGLDNSEETRESKLKNRPILTDNVSVSDPGSPAPPISSPYGSNSSSAIPNLPHVKTKLPTNPISPTINDSKEEPRDTMVQQQAGYPPGNPVWHYMPETHFPAPSVQQMPVYYMQSPVHHHQVHQQPVHMQPPPPQYVQRFQAPVGQIPVGYRHSQIPGVGQMYGGGGMRPVTHVEAAAAYETYSTPNTGGVMAPEQGGTGQQTMYYGTTRNTPMMQTYAAAASTMVQGGGGGTDHHQMQMQMQANPNNTHKDSQQTQ